MQDIARGLTRGQHVSAVLPQYLAADDEVRTHLIDALMKQVEGARQIHIWDIDIPLVEALGRQITHDDYPPTAVPDLLTHTDVAGRHWVLDALDLSNQQQQELPEILARVAVESRSIPSSNRATFAVVMTADSLPAFAGCDNQDVTHQSCWYWNRVARWDVAAHVAERIGNDRPKSIAAEVRAELIVELARWDLGFAESLSAEWDGTVDNFQRLAAGRYKQDESFDLGASYRYRDAPPVGLREQWNEGSVDVWHDKLLTAPGANTGATALTPFIWSAQARVLLPWLEIQRTQLEYETERLLGKQTFHAAVRAYSTGETNPIDSGSIIEIGLLEKVIRYDLKRTHPDLARVAASLRNARNDLAHIMPLEQRNIDELADTLQAQRG